LVLVPRWPRNQQFDTRLDRKSNFGLEYHSAAGEIDGRAAADLDMPPGSGSEIYTDADWIAAMRSTIMAELPKMFCWRHLRFSKV